MPTILSFMMPSQKVQASFRPNWPSVPLNTACDHVKLCMADSDRFTC